MSGVSIVVAGGGSAGHVNPALAIADAVCRAAPETHITFLGTSEGLEATLVPAHGYDLTVIPRVPLPRRATPQLLTVPTRVSRAVAAAGAVLDGTSARVVVGVGGYVALPAYLAARRRGIPVVVHEQNARPGIANRIGARSAAAVITSFPDTPLPAARFLGLPLRAAIAELDRVARRSEGRTAFGLDAERPTLLVTGGSQGARRINRAMVAALDALTRAGVQVLHHAGAHGVDEVRAAVAGRPADAPPYVVEEFITDMALAYAAADLVVCRAGANTCAELAAVGLPAVYVPLPHGNGEQRLNAQPLARAGGGIVVADERFDGEWVAGHVVPLIGDETRLATMTAAAATLGRRHADDEIAAVVLSLADGPAGARRPRRAGRS